MNSEFNLEVGRCLVVCKTNNLLQIYAILLGKKFGETPALQKSIIAHAR